jgi:hypothetical protein
MEASEKVTGLCGLLSEFHEVNEKAYKAACSVVGYAMIENPRENDFNSIVRDSRALLSQLKRLIRKTHVAIDDVANEVRERDGGDE